MEHLSRFITIVAFLALSLIAIHTIRAPQQVKPKMVPVACFNPKVAEREKADTALKWDAKIVYDTIESKGEVKSYRCYFAFPKTSVVCSPRDISNRKNIRTCPNFPSLLGNGRLCYFIDSAYHPLHKILNGKQKQGYQFFNGKIVKSISEAKKVLVGK